MAIGFTLVMECFEISLCMSAMFSSLNVRLHLKHFQLTSDICGVMRNFLISILHDCSNFFQFLINVLKFMKFLDKLRSFDSIFMTKCQSKGLEIKKSHSREGYGRYF